VRPRVSDARFRHCAAAAAVGAAAVRSNSAGDVASVTLEYCGVVKYDVLLRLMMPFCRHHTPATETRTVTED